jgi:tetratricopeptide (TPR) repeat protein
VFAPATHAYQTQYDGTLAHVDVASPDVSRPAAAPAAADWFYDLDGSAVPWIAALEPDGSGLAHVSSAQLSGRKLFAWGDTAGGRHWQDWLGGAYFEIQGGLAPTQYEHLRMPGNATWEWAETFLALQVDGAASAEWPSAVEVVGAEVRRAADATDAARLEAVADLEPEHLLTVGSPWGALEAALAARFGASFDNLPGVRFDAAAGEDAEYWRGLLGGASAGDDDVSTPPASYVAGPLWDRLLGEAPATWLTHCHRAVIAHAAGDHARAAAHYDASLRLRRTAWALRGLGQLRMATGETDAGIAHLTDAVSLAPGLAPLALELGEALLAAGRAEEASGFVGSLPAEVRARGRFRVLAVRAALASGAVDEARRMLEDEFDVPDIREGELSMSDLWREAFPDRPVPERYDFSMS